MFLSLILLLVLSLLLTIIEGARVNSAKVYAQRSLTTAMDSVLAEYYGPLWEEYHIFGLNTGDGSDVKKKKEKMETKLTDYMSYALSPKKGLNNGKEIELHNISLDSVAINSQTMLMDKQGELLINEAVEYMKYKEIGNGLEVLLNKASLLEKPNEVNVIYEKKQDVEEELVEIDIGILELMELLDGVQTGKNGIELAKGGTLKTATNFVKKICFGDVTKDTVGINNESIFLALENSYINPELELNAIKGKYTELEETLKRIQDIRDQIRQTDASLSSKQRSLQALAAIDDKSDEVKQQIKSIKKSIKSLAKKKKGLQKELEEKEKLKKQQISSIISYKKSLSLLIENTKPLINSAMASIDTIILKTEAAEPLIKEYEDSLYKERASIGEEIFAGMEESLEEVKRYTSTNENGYDFAGMKAILGKNLTVLTKVEIILTQGESELNQARYPESKATFSKAISTYKNYNIAGLNLDYSTLVLDNTNQESPFAEVNSLLQSGLTDLVLDPNSISAAELTREILPSKIAAMAKEDTDFLAGIATFFENIVTNGSSGSGNLFNGFSDGSQIMSMAGDGVNKIAEHFLYQAYLTEHFGMFPKEGEDIKKRKPSALVYEQEYLLVGKRSDQENLSSVISRIIFYRTILDFVSILGDKTRCNEAKLAAAALVGFTGLPILVSITQTLILLVWAFAEALLDTCALMMDKEVPILKKKMQLQLPEIFLLDRTFLQTKAKQMSETKELAFSYQEYLRIFLLLKKKEDLAYLTTDLIQENINLRYQDSFLIQNCLFGFRAKGEFTVKPKFTSLVQNQVGSSTSVFGFQVEEAYSY